MARKSRPAAAAATAAAAAAAELVTQAPQRKRRGGEPGEREREGGSETRHPGVPRREGGACTRPRAPERARLLTRPPPWDWAVHLAWIGGREPPAWPLPRARAGPHPKEGSAHRRGLFLSRCSPPAPSTPRPLGSSRLAPRTRQDGSQGHGSCLGRENGSSKVRRGPAHPPPLVRSPPPASSAARARAGGSVNALSLSAGGGRGARARLLLGTPSDPPI